MGVQTYSEQTAKSTVIKIPNIAYRNNLSFNAEKLLYCYCLLEKILSNSNEVQKQDIINRLVNTLIEYCNSTDSYKLQDKLEGELSQLGAVIDQMPLVAKQPDKANLCFFTQNPDHFAKKKALCVNLLKLIHQKKLYNPDNKNLQSWLEQHSTPGEHNVVDEAFSFISIGNQVFDYFLNGYNEIYKKFEDGINSVLSYFTESLAVLCNSKNNQSVRVSAQKQNKLKHSQAFSLLEKINTKAAQIKSTLDFKEAEVLESSIFTDEQKSTIKKYIENLPQIMLYFTLEDILHDLEAIENINKKEDCKIKSLELKLERIELENQFDSIIQELDNYLNINNKDKQKSLAHPYFNHIKIELNKLRDLLSQPNSNFNQEDNITKVKNLSTAIKANIDQFIENCSFNNYNNIINQIQQEKNIILNAINPDRLKIQQNLLKLQSDELKKKEKCFSEPESCTGRFLYKNKEIIIDEIKCLITLNEVTDENKINIYEWAIIPYRNNDNKTVYRWVRYNEFAKYYKEKNTLLVHPATLMVCTKNEGGISLDDCITGDDLLLVLNSYIAESQQRSDS